MEVCPDVREKELVDKVTFPALTAGSSYCRIPDGSTNWQISTTPTEGSTNQ